MGDSSYLAVIGTSQGSEKGSNLGVFRAVYHIPTRARAYNDLSKDAVLLKTASNRPLGYPLDDPKMGPILGPTDWHVEMASQVLRRYPCIRYVCGYVSHIIPQNGSILGVIQMTPRIRGPRILQMGRNVLVEVMTGGDNSRAECVGFRVCRCVMCTHTADRIHTYYTYV